MHVTHASAARALARHLSTLGFFTFAAVVMTWPLAPNLRTAAAHPADPCITSWILDWGFHALTHHPSRLFHANIFHPLPYTFAFSENMLGVLLMLFPLFAMNVPLLTLHNIAILGGYTTAGYAASLLGRHVTGSTAAGLAGGFFFAFVPWRFSHLTHLQHLWTMWLPLLILALLRLREQPTRKRAIALGACFVMNGLTNLHWLAFGSAAAALCVAIAAFAGSRAERRRFVLLAAAAIAGGTILLAPMLYPYWRAGRIYPMRGDAGETLHYSATPSSWLIPSLHNRFYGPRFNDDTVDPERWAFPGLIGPILATIGAIVTWRRSPLTAAIGIALIALGFLGSLGLHTAFGRILFDYVPLFRGIRVPARWAMIAYLGVAMLASAGALAIARRRWMHAVVVALLFVELRAMPIRWYLSTGETPPVYAWLAQQQIVGAVMELPPDQPNVYAAMFWSHLHHKPLLNGVSGYKPAHYAVLEADWRTTPIPRSFFERVRQLGGTVIIVHHDRLGTRAGAARAALDDEVRRGRLALVGAFGNDVVYAPPTMRLSRPEPKTLPVTGALLHPVHWEEVTGPLEVNGRVAAPHGVAHVILHFDNGRTRYDARVDNGRFTRVFASRPSNVRPDTDLQVEIVGNDGERRRLRQVWLRWRRPGERLQEKPLPQTSDLGPYLVHPRHGDHLRRPQM